MADCTPADIPDILDHLADWDSHGVSARQVIQAFLIDREGSCLVAWRRHFDRAATEKVRREDFNAVLSHLKFPGPRGALFDALDDDASGQVTLEEINRVESDIWRRFRAWCGEVFPEGVAQMITKLNGSYVNHHVDHPGEHKSLPFSEKITQDQFETNIVKLGWTSGRENMLYHSLDLDGDGSIDAEDLEWVDAERKRCRRKEKARERSSVLTRNTQRSLRNANAQAVQKFKDLLRRKYGNMVRACRLVLSHSDTMIISKSKFLKACVGLGWKGDARNLWKALDTDDSGSVSVDELDPNGAEAFAHFQAFIRQEWGCADSAFRAIDKDGNGRIRKAEFVSKMSKFGYAECWSDSIFQGLDIHQQDFVVADNMFFLDKWKPLGFLAAKPNEEAAHQLKQLLLKQYKGFLKAWRVLLDRDGSNRCSWWEFVAACKKLGWPGDVPGAWRVFDDDCSGFIAFHEMDPISSMSLLAFKQWCDREFGLVKCAFEVFEKDAAGEVNYLAWKTCCRIYGFEGKVRSLFQTLDVEGHGVLTLKEVAFLDDMEFGEDLLRRKAIKHSISLIDSIAGLSLPDGHDDEDGHPKKAAKRSSTLGLRGRLSQLSLFEDDGHDEEDVSLKHKSLRLLERKKDFVWKVRRGPSRIVRREPARVLDVEELPAIEHRAAVEASTSPQKQQSTTARSSASHTDHLHSPIEQRGQRHKKLSQGPRASIGQSVPCKVSRNMPFTTIFPSLTSPRSEITSEASVEATMKWELLVIPPQAPLKPAR
eukprot:gnl/TRDRNA2_/TRDRNA2_135537_c0_seq1.p1 gnl/TRDRNA2_/TRDRNA2_135537_c0~~gnl/TRDRNA2_/TRDRNA2_135537_c0_seq1.p1  ORF type:complete len:763 (-),score=108.91 gnl/TRDRNA2_/TRDRNA2_135537_c0_seq1:96-2384(-)